MTRTLLLLGLLAAATLAQEVLIWHPGQGGSAAQAAPVLDDFARYLESTAGLQAGTLSIRYAASEDEGPQGAENPELCIVSLPIFLKYQEQMGWTAVLQAERMLRPEGRYMTVVYDTAGALLPIADVVSEELPAGLQVYGTEWDAHFVDEFLLPAEGATYTQSRSPNGAMRKGKKPGTAVILDENFYQQFQTQAKYADNYRPIHISPPLPVNLVVVREGADCAAMLDALRTMNEVEDTTIVKLRKTMDLQKFVDVDENFIAELIERY